MYELDNQTWTKITSKSPPNFDRRKKNQWGQNTNHPDVTNEVVVMEEWTAVNLGSVNRQMKRRRPQPQDIPVLKVAQDIIVIMGDSTPMQTRKLTQQVVRQKANWFFYFSCGIYDCLMEQPVRDLSEQGVLFT